MSSDPNANAERRNAPRKPYRGTVELADGDASGHEADGVDLSLGGMSLKTAYLPDVGSEVDCRFGLADGAEVAATGEVMWANDASEGTDAGAMGLRFTKLSPQGRKMLQRALDPEANVDDPRGKSPGESVIANHAGGTARMFLPGMKSPLRTQVRTTGRDAVVLGSELSFLKLGEHVQVERDGQKREGSIDDIGIEVDPTTRAARLVLTVSLASDPARHPARTTVTPPPPAPVHRTAERTAVLSPAPTMAPSAPVAERSWSDEPVHARADDHAADELRDDEDDDALASVAGGPAPPAWMVSLMARARAGSRTAAARLAALARTSATTLGEQIEQGRARLSGVPVEAARASQPGRRPQHSIEAAAPFATSPDTARLARRVALGVLGVGGVAAIGYALFSGPSTTTVAPPHPQLAVASTESPAAPAPSAATAAPVAPIEAPTAPLDPSSVGYAPQAPAAPVADVPAHALPSDLAAAAHMSDPIAHTATVRPAYAHPVAPRALVARPAAVLARPAAALGHPIAPAGARLLGSSAVHTGTMLHLRLDGPVASALTGGPTGNTLVVHIPGRRSIDMAAPLVHQDPRLAGASVYNRASGAELTLRFHDAVPGFAARVQGSTLEIVLASAHAAPVAAHRRR